MSTYPQARRNRAIPLLGSGINQSLNAPGEALVPAPVSRTVTAFGQLENALGLGVNLVGNLATAKQQSDVIEAGNASLDISSQLPGIEGQIAEGKLTAQPQDIVDQIAAGQSPAYRKRAAELVTGRIAAANERRRQHVQELHATEQTAISAASVGGATDPAAYSRAFDEIKRVSPDTPDVVARSQVIDFGLKHAEALALTDPAAARTQIDAAEKFGGADFSTDILIARNRVDAATRQAQNQAYQSLQDDVGKMLDANAPFPSVLQFVAEQGQKLGVDVHGLVREIQTEHQVLHNRREQAKTQAEQDAAEATSNAVAKNLIDGHFDEAAKSAMEAKGIPASRVLGLLDQVRSHYNAAISDSRQLIKQQEDQTLKQSALSQAGALWAAGRGAEISDFEAVRQSDGTTFKMTGQELRDAKAQEILQKIAVDGQRLGQTPQQIQAQQMREIGRNAYVPPAAKRTIEGGADSISEVAFADTQAGQSVPISPDAVAGFNLYKAFRSGAPGPLSSMNLSARTKAIYEGAMVLEGIPKVGGNPAEALKNAAIAYDRPATDLDPALMAATVAVLDVVSKSDRDIAADAMPIASILTKLGQTPDNAVAAAIDQVGKGRVKINGWSSRAGNIPPDLKGSFVDIAEQIIGDYAKANKDAGIRPSDIAFRYNPINDLWTMIDHDTGLTMPGGPNEIFFTTAELLSKARKLGIQPDVQRELFRQRLRDNQPSSNGEPAPSRRFLNLE